MRLPCSHLDIPPALLFCSEDSHKALRNGATGHTGRQVRLSGSRARIGLCLADAHSVPAEPVDTRVAPIAVEGSACRALAFLFEPSKGFFRCGPVGPLVRFVLCFFCSARAGSWAGVIFGLFDSESWGYCSCGCETSARDCGGHNTVLEYR